MANPKDPADATKPVTPLQGIDRLTPDEAAKLLNTTAHTLWVWRRRGYGPPFRKIGRCVKYSQTEVLTWYEQQKQVPDENIELTEKGLALLARQADLEARIPQHLKGPTGFDRFKGKSGQRRRRIAAAVAQRQAELKAAEASTERTGRARPISRTYDGSGKAGSAGKRQPRSPLSN